MGGNIRLVFMLVPSLAGRRAVGVRCCEGLALRTIVETESLTFLAGEHLKGSPIGISKSRKVDFGGKILIEI